MTNYQGAVAIVNFGDESIALMQWLINKGHSSSVTLLYVDTGMIAKRFTARVKQALEYAKSHGFTVVKLNSPSSWSEMVLERKSFPSKKFQWCAGFLKGLAINDYLDEVDLDGKKMILMAKRREASRANQLLPAAYFASEHFGERMVFYPLWEYDWNERNELIAEAGFELTYPRSLECEPCIHSSDASLALMDKADISRLVSLEAKVNQSMFESPIEEKIKNIRQPQSSEDSLRGFEMGCGMPWGCGE